MICRYLFIWLCWGLWNLNLNILITTLQKKREKLSILTVTHSSILYFFAVCWRKLNTHHFICQPNWKKQLSNGSSWNALFWKSLDHFPTISQIVLRPDCRGSGVDEGNVNESTVTLRVIKPNQLKDTKMFHTAEGNHRRLIILCGFDHFEQVPHYKVIWSIVNINTVIMHL